MDRGKHCGEEALAHSSSTNKHACTHMHADTSRCTCSNIAKRAPLQAHMPHDLHTHTLAHVARGDFSITASAKQSPERDVPCLSGKAFQPRFFFKSVPVPVVRQLSGTQSEMTLNKAANVSTVKLHGERWKKTCFF